MIRVKLIGKNGNMGKSIQEVAEQMNDILIVEENEDVIIDFSHFSKCGVAIERALENQVPIVIGTTALEDSHFKMMDKAAEKIPVLYSANMSLGINLMCAVLEQMTSVLKDDFEMAIFERHHKNKKDAPSGTAYLLLDSMAKNNESIREKVQMSSARGGSIPGEHSVMFMGLDENIEIKHEALSRKIFAKGAIMAARFLLEQENGRFNMRDVLGV